MNTKKKKVNRVNARQLAYNQAQQQQVEQIQYMQMQQAQKAQALQRVATMQASETGGKKKKRGRKLAKWLGGATALPFLSLLTGGKASAASFIDIIF